MAEDVPPKEEKHSPTIEGPDGVEIAPGMVGTLVRCSASSFDTLVKCPLAFYFDKHDHLERKPESKGQKTGKKGHDEYEHWLLTGEDVRGNFARAGTDMIAPYLPRAPFNGGDMVVEGKRKTSDKRKSIKLLTPGGVLVIGYLDVLLPMVVRDHDRYLIEEWPHALARCDAGGNDGADVYEAEQLHKAIEAAGAFPEVLDHKFKKDIEPSDQPGKHTRDGQNGYALTPAELLVDTQAVFYGKWCFNKWPDAPFVRFAHHNHCTSCRNARRVQVDLDRAHVEREWAIRARLIDNFMSRIAAQPTPATVPHPEDDDDRRHTCLKYGGCDFERTCPHSPRNVYAESFFGE